MIGDKLGINYVHVSLARSYIHTSWWYGTPISRVPVEFEFHDIECM